MGNTSSVPVLVVFHRAPNKEGVLPQWVIVGHFIDDAATPDEAEAWLANELRH